MRNSIRTLTAVSAIALLFTSLGLVRAEAESTSSELDAFWASMSRYVKEGDFSGLKSTYHPDAVLVDGVGQSSYAISEAFDRWEQGIRDTRLGNTEAGVRFRFTQRLHDENTAHETGIFHYTEIPKVGEAQSSYIHFEALLINQNGWKMIMEYQKARATKEEWDSANP